MKKYPVIGHLNSQSRVMFGGLMALSLVCLSILAGKSSHDLPILVGIFSFSIAIPCLAFCAERVRIDALHKTRVHSIWIDVAEGCGIFGSLIGFGSIFWHFSIIAAITFIIASLCMNALLVWYEDAMQSSNRNALDD